MGAEGASCRFLGSWEASLPSVPPFPGTFTVCDPVCQSAAESEMPRGQGRLPEA